MRSASERTYALDSQLEEEAVEQVQKVVAVFGACHSGPCNQGRSACPTREACRLYEEVSRFDGEGTALMRYFVIGVVLAVCAALVGVWLSGGI